MTQLIGFGRTFKFRRQRVTEFKVRSRFHFPAQFGYLSTGQGSGTTRANSRSAASPLLAQFLQQRPRSFVGLFAVPSIQVSNIRKGKAEQ
jgi:hypothetical protein